MRLALGKPHLVLIFMKGLFAFAHLLDDAFADAREGETAIVEEVLHGYFAG